MDYIDPILAGSGAFGDLSQSRLLVDGTVEGNGAPRSPSAAVTASISPLPAPPKPFPWWLVVLGVFVFLAVNES